MDLVSVINEDASPRGAARGRLRSGLVVAQVAVSLLLLVGAGLVTRSLEAARHVNTGFDASQVTEIAVDLKQHGYDEARGRAFYRKLLDSPHADAGAESASSRRSNRCVSRHAVAPRRDRGLRTARGADLAFLSTPSDPTTSARFGFRSSPDGSSRTAMKRRRHLSLSSTTRWPQRFWGGAAQALGKRVRLADGEWRTIVGVAADIKYVRLNESPRPYVYLPFLQSYRASMIVHTRVTAPMDTAVESARAHVAALDGDLPILYAKKLADRMKGALLLFNLTATMLSVFGLAGMALAALGTYGLVSYSVTQSTHEIGIRMALGASTAWVLRRFLGRGLRLGAIGIIVGTAAAFAVTRLLSGALFGVSATDPISYARALAIVIGVVAAATLIPAWRAARTNPLSALRHQ